MSDRWYHQMACRDEDPALFEKPDIRGRIPKHGRDDKWAIPALLVCKSCPVQARCLEEAINAPDTYHRGADELTVMHVPMVVGGVLPWQLEKLRERRRAS